MSPLAPVVTPAEIVDPSAVQVIDGEIGPKAERLIARIPAERNRRVPAAGVAVARVALWGGRAAGQADVEASSEMTLASEGCVVRRLLRESDRIEEVVLTFRGRDGALTIDGFAYPPRREHRVDNPLVVSRVLLTIELLSPHRGDGSIERVLIHRTGRQPHFAGGGTLDLHRGLRLLDDLHPLVRNDGFFRCVLHGLGRRNLRRDALANAASEKKQANNGPLRATE